MRSVETTRAGNAGSGYSKGRLSKKLNADSFKNSLSPLDFYRHELPGATSFKKHGWNDGGFCPFHADNSTGSFRVNVTTGQFKCFSCGASGSDVIAFTMAKHGLQFTNALAKLVDDWGLI